MPPPKPGPWEFKLMHQLVVCNACGTTNRLAYQRPLPACGKCKGTLLHARTVPPTLYHATRFTPTTHDGEQLLDRLDEAAKYLGRGQFLEAARIYDSTLQVIMQFLVPEQQKLEELKGEAEYNLGACHYLLESYREAGRDFKRAVSHLRFAPATYLWLLAALELAGTSQAEASFLARTLGREMPPSVRKSLAPRWAYQGDPNADRHIRAFFELFLRDDPGLLKVVQLEAGLI